MLSYSLLGTQPCFTQLLADNRLARSILQTPAAWSQRSLVAFRNAFPRVRWSQSEVVDGLLLMNDTPYAVEPFFDLNTTSSACIRVLGPRDFVTPLLPSLRKACEEEGLVFVLPGEGARSMLALIEELEPALARTIRKRGIRVSPVRSLGTKGEPSVSLPREDQRLLFSLDASSIAVIDDVIASGATLGAISWALAVNSGRPKVRALAGVLAYRAQSAQIRATSLALERLQDIEAAVLVKASDDSIPPVNTLSTFFLGGRKAELASNGMSKYLVYSELQAALRRSIADSFGLDQDALAEVERTLQKLQGKVLVFCDLDGTLCSGSSNRYAEARAGLAEIRKLEKRTRLLLNSDSPLMLLRDLAPSTPLLAERGCLLSFGNVELPLVPDLPARTSALLADILQALRSNPATGGIDIIEDPSASLRINDPACRFPGTGSAIIVNSGRMVSLGFFTRRLSPSGQVYSLEPQILQALIRTAAPLAEEAGFELAAYPAPEGSLLVRPLLATKTAGLRRFLDLARALGFSFEGVYMVGDSDADFIDDRRVTSIAVANGSAEFRSKTSYSTPAPALQGVLEFVQNLEKGDKQ